MSKQHVLTATRTDEQQRPYEKTHGVSHTPEYNAWAAMRRRCYEPTDQAYGNYGGRGITVCARWLESPLNFIEDMGLRPSPRHTLDREKNHLGYSKENCRWVTHQVNNQNRRSNRMVTYQGETLPLIVWIRKLELSESLVANRVAAGWSVEDVFTKPVQPRDGSTLRHCLECGKICRGDRCQPCENKTRHKRRTGVK